METQSRSPGHQVSGALRSVPAVLWASRWTAVVTWAAVYVLSLVVVLVSLVVVDATGRYGVVPLLIGVLLVAWLLGATVAATALALRYRRMLLGRGPIRFRTALARTALLAAGFVLGWICFIVPGLYLVAATGRCS